METRTGFLVFLGGGRAATIAIAIHREGPRNLHLLNYTKHSLKAARSDENFPRVSYARRDPVRRSVLIARVYPA